MSDTSTTSPDAPSVRPLWGSFALICLAYLVSTTGEQMLSPLFPTASEDLGLSVAQGGIAFGLLSGSIAVMNLVGGLWMRRTPSVVIVRISALVGAVGSVITALAGGFGVLVVGQILLGSSAGLFFPAGLQMAGLAAGPSRRGFAMGMYGVAFSAGLTMAAILGTIGSGAGWRVPFWIGAVLFAIAATSGWWIRVPPAPAGTATTGAVSIRQVLSLPTAVGSSLAVCQYGAIPFLATFAVLEWDLTPARAATILLIGRLLSIVAKIVGGASADRIGAHASARRTGVLVTATGLAWIFIPASLVTSAIAAVFVGAVSSLGPVANALAVERFGQNGMALGAYRSIQIALGAAASAMVGVVADRIGLRITLAAAILVPLTLLWVCRPSVATRTVAA